jgi:hypothetical protein
MRTILRSILGICCLSALSVAGQAQSVTVGTSYSETATYSANGQTAGPFPWSDLGITASATIAPGMLNVSTGGSTTYKLDTTVGSGESFVPGSTVLNLGYTPNFTGSFSTPVAATGNLSSNFVYNIGPFSGSDPLISVGLATGGENKSLSSALDSGIGAVGASQNVSGPGIAAGVGVQAQACFIVCATVASASLSFNVGSQIQQNVVATPIVTYGDLVWESKTQTYSPTDSFTFVPGAAGNVANTFIAPPASLGLTSGETFYYNFLPVIEVNMPVVNTAEVNVPASITASYDIFGAGGSQNFPLGNLYSLGAAGAFDFDPTFNAGSFYSVPLEYQAAHCVAIACFGATYTTPSGGGGPTVDTPGGGVPGDSGPCGPVIVDCNLNVSTTPEPPGGYGNMNMGPLFPGGSGPVCGPAGTAFAGECVNMVNQTPDIPTPEPGSAALLSLGLLGLGYLTLRKTGA